MGGSSAVGWLSVALGAAAGAGLGAAGADLAALLRRASMEPGALAAVALHSAAAATLLALLPALGLAGLLGLALAPASPGEAFRAARARLSAAGAAGATVALALYAAAVVPAALAAQDAIRTDALRLWASTLAATAALAPAWLIGVATTRGAARLPGRKALAVPLAAGLALLAGAILQHRTLALLGVDPLLGPAAVLAGTLAAGAVAALGRARARAGIALLAVVLPGALLLPVPDAARAALVFDAPIAASLLPLVPGRHGERTLVGRSPPPFALTRDSALRRRWPIVLVTVDSLRPDHLGTYGYRRPTSPHIDALARRALVFERAYATGSSTRFSVPAMMTSRFMSQLAMRGRAVLPSNTTFAERLAGAGYETVGLMSTTERGTGPGVGQGFREFRHSMDLRGEHVDAGITDEAIARLERAPLAAPLLLWVHYYDPHTPWSAQPGSPAWGEGDRDRYDREVWATDREIGRLLTAVDRRFGSEGAVVVLSADHGEAFGEHGKLGHSGQLYEELVRVPLIVRVPGARPGRTTMLASLLDLFPTFLDLAGVAHPAVLEGRSLVPWLSGAPPDRDRLVFEELRFGRPEDRGMTAVHEGRWHLLVDAATDTAVLYDVQRDPFEQRPVRSAPQVVARLHRAVRELRGRIAAERTAPGRSE